MPKYKGSEELTAALGRNGVINTSDDTPVVAAIAAIYCTDDVVFAELTEAEATGSTALEWDRKEWIFGQITGYTLASGSVRAYKA